MYRETEADTILPTEHNPRPPASSYPEIDLTYWIYSRDYEHHTYLNRTESDQTKCFFASGKKNLGNKFYKCAHFDHELKLSKSEVRLSFFGSVFLFSTFVSMLG